MPRGSYEVIIVGGGIAGAAAAYFLSEAGIRDILVLERENHLAVHSTGRSAASISAYDENETVLDLKIAGSRFWQDPPTGFTEEAPLQQVGVVSLFEAADYQRNREREADLRARGLEFEFLSPADCRSLVPVLGFESLAGGIFAPRDGRLDVHAILQAYLRSARSKGAELVLGAEVRGLLRDGERIVGVELKQGKVHGDTVINAAGAWASQLGTMAEALDFSLQPMRRSLFTFPGPVDEEFSRWPMVWSDPHEIYFVAEAGEMMLSPMDQVPMDACDPSTDDETVAAAIERLRSLAPTLVPRTIRSRWAGLRTFAPDGAPVIGPDPVRPGFFWVAGMGGAGIETSPAYGRIAADLLVGRETGFAGVERIRPERFRKLAAQADSG